MPETSEQHNRRNYDAEVGMLKERVSNWMESTTEYRHALCSKIDGVIKTQNEIISRLDKLPCDARKPMWDNLNKQVIAIWGFIGAIVVAIIVDWLHGK